MMLAGYQIIEEIYKSSSNLVLRGRRESDGQGVIIKILNSEPPSFEDVAEFKHEYQILTDLQGLGCVPHIYELKKYENTWMFELEDIHAKPLSHFIEKKSFGLLEWLSLAIKIVSAIESIHKKGVLHKDINPGNIIWNPVTKKLQIIDFDLASKFTQENAELSLPFQKQGALAYMSPEQTGRMNRSVDYRSDFYSLGVTFYQMLTGQLPFHSDDPLTLVHQHIAQVAKPLNEIKNEIPEVISSIVLKLMEKKAEQRYQTEYGLIYDLQKCLTNLEQEGVVTFFKIGKHDLVDRFEIPQKFYGREDEINRLLGAFEKACSGHPQIITVSGYTGIGKSTLIHEIYKPIVINHGYFIQGKFDQFQRNLPCLALRRMLQDLCKQIMSERVEQRAHWKERILQAVGRQGRILTNLAPEMESIIGKQDEQDGLTKLDLVADSHRFIYVLNKLVQVLTEKEHPLVIFWDDMQWADSISLKLLENWATKIKSGYLFIILSYRDNEVGRSHPLHLMVNRIQSTSAFSSIHLQPLNLDSITQLIADTLHTSSDQVVNFAKICHKKTGDNPFYLKQFLLQLHHTGKISFDAIQRKWIWDIDNIKEETIADNLIEFMVSRINELPCDKKKMLSFAACIGNIFTLNALAILLDKSQVETAHGLNFIIEKNYLIPYNEKCLYATEIENSSSVYRFSHDKIQEAAYSLLDDKTRAEIHLEIGRILINSMKKHEFEDHLIMIVDHLDRGKDLLVTDDEKNELIKLNLQAGIKAKLSIAYEQADYYFTMGISLLNKQDWEDKYELCLSLYTEAAEISCILVHYKRMDFLNASVLKHAKTVLDLVRPYRIKILSQITRREPLDAIKTASIILNKLDFNLPISPKIYHMIPVILKARLARHKVSIENSLLMPKMTDERVLAILQVMNDIMTCCVQVSPVLFGFMMGSMFYLTMTYGISEIAPLAFVGYGVIEAGVMKHFDTGYEYGNIGFEMARRYNYKKALPRSIAAFVAFINHAKQHHKESLSLIMEGYQTAIDTGNLEFIFLLSFAHTTLEFNMGYPLDKVLEKVNILAIDMKKSNQDFGLQYIEMHQQAIVNLLGKSNKTHQLLGPCFNETKKIRTFHKKNDLLAINFVYIIKLMLACFFGNFEIALTYSNQIRKTVKRMLSHLYYPVYLFYDSLAKIAVYANLPFRQRWSVKSQINQNIRELRHWADSCPKNYMHRYYLVKAELARSEKNFEEASDYYDKAIITANENEFIHEEALAKELTAKFYFSHKKDKIARIYLLESFNSYSAWGATAKINQLKDYYPWLSRIIDQPQSLNNFLSMLTTNEGYQVRTLDYASAMKASIAVGNEIVLPELIAKLLNILNENMAAERCVLLLKRNDQLFIEGEIQAGKGLVNLMQSIPLAKETNILSSLIIQYVDASQKSIVLDNASKAEQFTRDIYIKKFAPKSVLCSSILYQGQLLGILYFENNLVTGAFTPDRLEFLSVFSSQIAISIKNARLYKSFECFVPRPFLDLLGKKDIVDIKLGDSIQKNLSVLFADICGFTSLCEQINAVKLFELLNQFLTVLEPIITRHNGFIDKFIGDAIMALFPTSPDDSLDAAIEMQQAIDHFNKHHKITLSAGIGINTGLCMLGTVGSSHRMGVTVISDTVNTASRIEGVNREYGTRILISDQTKIQLKNSEKYALRFIDAVFLKGKKEATLIWESLDGLANKVKQVRTANQATFDAAVTAYQATDFVLASKLFAKYLKEDPKDPVANLLLTYCSNRGVSSAQSRQNKHKK